VFRAALDDASSSEKQRVPEPAPVFDVVIDEEGRHRIRFDILHSAQAARVPRLRFRVDGVVDGVAAQDETDRHQ